MPVRRSRKGKQGTASGAKQAAAVPNLAPPFVTETSHRSITTTTQPTPVSSHSVVGHSTPLFTGGDNNDSDPFQHLILTSDKRRGVYECDYCGCDVSQTPRIRCASCVDFDVCCDCFITTDPMTAIARLQTVANASSSSLLAHQHDWDGAYESASSLMTPPQHDPLTHGYRVCDSTRYPLFPINAAVVAASTTTTTTNINHGSSSISCSQSNTNVATTIASTSTSHTIQDSNNDSSDNLMPPRKKRIHDEGVGVQPLSDDMDGVEVYDEKSDRPEATVDDTATKVEPIIMTAGDDNKTIWTMEEDLRLLCGIQTHGLGNWTEISDAVAGQGSSGKTPKRCMERYFDDYMGRYGHILPPYTLIGEATTNTSTGTFSTNQNPDTDDDTETIATTNVGEGDTNNTTTTTPAASTPGTATLTELGIRSSKRRSTMLRTPGGGTSTLPVAKKYLAVPTESLPEYQHIQLKPFLPKLDTGSATMGQEVGRDQATRAELAYVRTISGLDNAGQVDRIRRDWEVNRLNQPGGPTVLPLRPDDVPKLPGSEIAGYMPRRGDFDIEHENNAEEAIADMEFLPGESEQDRNLKLAVLAIYHSKLVERNKRKQFIISRKLYDYKSYQEEYQKLPRDERDLVLRMRLFERFHTPEEHKIFIADILKAKRLRKEIAKIQMYRRIGIRTQLEAERYEMDKTRRLFHTNAVAQYQDTMTKSEMSTAKTTTGSSSGTLKASSNDSESASMLYWKQYRTTDRKVRRSVNRGTSDEANVSLPPQSSDVTIGKSEDSVMRHASDGETSRAAPSNNGNNVPMTTPVGDDMEVDGASSGKHVAVEESGGAADIHKNDDHEIDTGGDNVDIDDHVQLPGYHQLSSREVDLIRSIQISPQQYIQIKKALIYESLQHGLLSSSSSFDPTTIVGDESPADPRRMRRSTSGHRMNPHNHQDNTDMDDSSKPASLSSPPAHTLFLLDVERRGTIVDFVLQAGWITTQYGKSVRDQ